MSGIISNALALAAVSVLGASTPQTFAAAVSERGTVVLPMIDRQGFSMVEGRVNGRTGLFMLDTGTPFSAFLNIDYLGLPRGPEVARGSASSGQGIVVLRQPCLHSLSIAGRYTLETLCSLRGANLRFVAQELDQRFLGFLGYELFKPYRVTFDHAAHRLILSDRARPVEPGALAEIRFSAENRQVPAITVTANGLAIPAKMDSGDQGHVYLNRKDADRLMASGTLIHAPGERGRPDDRKVLTGVEYDGITLRTSDLPVTISDEPSDIMLGFRFLHNYRSQWDYSDLVVRLYARS